MNDLILHWEKSADPFEYDTTLEVIMLLFEAEQLIALPVPSFIAPRLEIKAFK